MKNLVISYLNKEETISSINKKRVNYNHNMTSFCFFKIMIEVLKDYGFICSIGEPQPCTFDNNTDESTLYERELYIFKKDELGIKPLRSKYNIKELADNLLEFNMIQGNFGCGMRESAKILINIFIDLL